MGLYNFQARFVPYVEDGSKMHTIRAPRKRQEQPGNMLHLYTGLRHKGARLLKRVQCAKVQAIRISVDGIWIDGVKLAGDEADLLAWRDGFRRNGNDSTCAFEYMLSFWEGRLPFEGQIIHWGAA